MHRSFFAIKDATINSGSNPIDGTTWKDKNTGQDEILELKKYYFDSKLQGSTRILVQFDTSKIISYISSSVLPNDYKVYLRLWEAAGTSGLSDEYNVMCYPVNWGKDWDEGPGREDDNPKTTDGVSWLYRKNSNGIEVEWGTPGALEVSGDAIRVSQSFSLSSPDIEMDITKQFKYNQRSAIAPKDSGYLLTLGSGSHYVNESPTTYEQSTGSFEDLKFFSRQTNTIYSPKLEIRWDDHLPATGSNTGSLTPLDLSGQTENYVYQLHTREAYKETETVKFRFGARKRYIDKSFTTSVQTVSGSYFAEGSASYSIIDMATNEDVIPFSAYTTMSCDPISPYFTQDLNTFEPNRAYKILLKVKHNDGQVIVYDDDFEFILRS